MFGGERRDPRPVHHGYGVGEHQHGLSLSARLLEGTIERFRLAHLNDLDFQMPLRRGGLEILRLISLV